MTRSSYQIRVVGALGPVAREAFDGLEVDVEPTATVLSGELEQADLHALLDRMRGLGLELLDLRRMAAQPVQFSSGDDADAVADQLGTNDEEQHGHDRGVVRHEPPPP